MTQNKTQPQAKKPKMTINNLADLSKLLSFTEEAEQDGETPPQPTALEKRQAYNEYRNSTYELVSIMAYLLGIDKERFSPEGSPFLEAHYTELNQSKDARIIRNLSRIRSAIEKNYIAIIKEFRNNFKNIGSVPDLIPAEALDALGQDGIQLFKAKPDIDEYMITINTEISNRINTVSPFFPEWVKWDYIRPVFIMPGGTKKEGIKKAGELYNQDRQRYPFHCWLNWKAVSTGTESKGNILYDDEKFVKILYERNEDRFENLSLVRDVGNHTMRNLDELLDRCRKCLIVVDCENSDAVKLAAALSSLPAHRLDKIAKVLLFDSDYTTDQWKTMVNRSLIMAMNNKASPELEHINVQRVNQSKSQVDMTLAVRTSREVFTAGVDAVILVSSDSDYWALIQQLPDVKFLVMLERRKTGLAIMDTLAIHDILFCFIDDFCTSASYTIKTGTLLGGIQQQIDAILAGEGGVAFNARQIMENTLQNSWITMTEKEKEGFYSRYLLHMRLNVAADGAVSISLGQ